MRAIPTISSFDFEVVLIDQYGNISNNQTCQSRFFRELIGNGVYLDMVQTPEIDSSVGSPNTETGRSNDEKQQHSVTLVPFFIGKYPVTQAQWQIVASFPKVNQDLDPDPSHFKGSNRPVEQVSWFEALEFCIRLSKITGREYRLPTEVEWEYACRAGTLTPFHFGDTLTTDLANYWGEDSRSKGRTNKGFMYKGSYGDGPGGIARKETTEVGSFGVANAFGLFDMHGNVGEWSSKHPSLPDLNESTINQIVSLHQEEKYQQPVRGGSWCSPPAACRSAFRLLLSPNNKEPSIGFRVVCSDLTNGYFNANPPKRRILVLVSSPADQQNLRQDKEVREITLALEHSQEQFDLQPRLAVRLDDLQNALLNLDPQVVHFSGHGAGSFGLALEDETGKARWIQTGPLANLFKRCAKRGLECVVLNACYSDVLAEAIAQDIQYVIGMNDAISNNAAISFVRGFYRALAAGYQYEDAYQEARGAIELEGIPEELIPVLKKKLHLSDTLIFV
jgi:formylglycine-generating enzyme required for sulfatase activity